MEKKLPDDTWVSSRELMERQGISRGTLNNYIKAGLLPRPAVRGAREGMKGTKQIGYFPPEAVEKMEKIRRLKENGKSMEEVIALLSVEAVPKRGEARKMPPEAVKAESPRAKTPSGARRPGEDIPHPAYGINHSLRILWLNSRYKNDFMHGKDPLAVPGAHREDIFPGFLGENWKERWTGSDAVLDAHLSILKTVFSEEGLIPFLNGGAGDAVVQRLAQVKAHEKRFVLSTPLVLEKIGGGEEWFRLYGLCLREGLCFAWEPMRREGHRGADRPVPPVDRPGVPVRDEEKGEFIVLTAKMEGTGRLCAELPSREYGALMAGVADLAKETIRRQGGIPGNPDEDRFHGYFLWGGMRGYTAGKAITCAMMLKEKMNEFRRTWSDRKQTEIPLVLNLGIGWGTGILRTEGSYERTALSFAGDALHRSAGLASFARDGAVLVMKELVEKAENDYCSFHYGVLKKTADGEEKRERIFFRIADRRDAGGTMREDVREVASVAITEVFPEKE